MDPTPARLSIYEAASANRWRTVLLVAVFTALVAVLAYFVGVGLIGAGLAVLVLDSGWRLVRHADPPMVAIVVVAVLGALLALSVVRWIVIFGTAISGC